MTLNKKIIITLSIFFFLFSCKEKKHFCITDVKVYSNRELPILDVIKFSINSNEHRNALDVSNIERVFFMRKKDTIDNIGYIKTKISLNQISFFYRTTKYLSYKDSLEIKNDFLSQNIIILLKNNEVYELNNCRKW